MRVRAAVRLSNVSVPKSVSSCICAQSADTHHLFSDKVSHTCIAITMSVSHVHIMPAFLARTTCRLEKRLATYMTRLIIFVSRVLPLPLFRSFRRHKAFTFRCRGPCVGRPVSVDSWFTAVDSMGDIDRGTLRIHSDCSHL